MKADRSPPLAKFATQCLTCTPLSRHKKLVCQATVEMSCLCHGRCRVCVSCQPPPFAPRMSRGRLDRTPRDLSLGGRSHSLGTSGDGVIVQWAAVGRDPHRPIHPVFDYDVGRPDIGPHLIEAPVVGHRPVTAQAPCGLDTQDTVQTPARWLQPMQIGGLGRLDREAPIVDRQPRLQEPIRGLDRGNARQSQLFHEAILHRLEQPLHPPLRLRGVGRDQLDPQPPSARPN